MSTQLPTEVIDTDHNLENIADKASGSLARHRWHWTLDESNSGRVSIKEYARQVGRDDTGISRTVRGYASFIAQGGDNGRPLEDHMARAGMSVETEAAADAVAKARGVTISTVRTGRTAETRQVRETARQLAEERGTSVAEEAPRVAAAIVKSEQADKATAAAKAEHTDIRFFEMERYLINAKRELMRAVKLAPQVAWDDEHRDLLGDTLGNVKSLLGLLDAAISGMSGTDWDAEFAKIGQAS